MEDAIDLELGEHAIEEAGVGHRADELARDERRERGIEPVQIERDHAAVGAGQRRQQTVSHSPLAPVISTTGLHDRSAGRAA